MSVIHKITLFELFNKVHKLITPLYVIEYNSGTITTSHDFASLPKQAKKIIRTNYYNAGYTHKFTELNGFQNDLHITEYERIESL